MTGEVADGCRPTVTLASSIVQITGLALLWQIVGFAMLYRIPESIFQ